MSSTYLFENQHIPTQAFSLQINWNLQLRHEPPVASACPLGTANMASQVTILATLPRSDKIQMKSRRVLCWPKPAFTAPTATVLLQEAACPGQAPWNAQIPAWKSGVCPSSTRTGRAEPGSSSSESRSLQ